MRVPPVSPARRPLSSERAGEIEVQLRARSEKLKPRGTALGICHACATIVYSGDSLAIVGGVLQHDDCTPGGAGRHAETA
jgi:hypothetical protein